MLTSPEAYLGALRPKNLHDVFDAPELTIGMIRQETGEVGARAVLSLLVAEVVSFFNVGKTMNDKQIAQTCDLIMDIYHYLKPEDFKLCFRNAMLRKYGKLYDRLDGSVILDWLATYVMQRNDAAPLTPQQQAEKERNEKPVSLEEYLAGLQIRIEQGDMKAKEAWDNHMHNRSRLKEPDYLKPKKKQEEWNNYRRLGQSE